MSTTIGARADRFGLARAATVDPRLNVRIGLGRTHALRLATGVYHQAPSPLYYDRQRGASRLPPMRALHYVAGYEAGREAEGIYVRAEGFVKTYRDLPLEDDVRGYTADGYGSAHGVDLFVQWLSSRLEVRGTASWLRARRRWTPVDQRERYDLPDGTWAPDFEIPWSVQVIASVPLSSSMRRECIVAVGRRPTPHPDRRRPRDRRPLPPRLRFPSTPSAFRVTNGSIFLLELARTGRRRGGDPHCGRR